MTNEEYLQSLLKAQDLADPELLALRSLRDTIEQQLRTGLLNIERVYYAGSFGKKTMIREQYDLDIVVYWANDCGYTLKDIYNAVGNAHNPQVRNVKSTQRANFEHDSLPRNY